MCPSTDAEVIADSRGSLADSHRTKDNQFKQIEVVGRWAKIWVLGFLVVKRNCLIDICYKDISVLFTS